MYKYVTENQTNKLKKTFKLSTPSFFGVSLKINIGMFFLTVDLR